MPAPSSRLLLALLIGLALPAAAQPVPEGGALAGARYRVLVSTDLGGSDEDDMQSLIHLLLYADLFDLEGLIASPPHAGRKEDILNIIDIYAQDYPTLRTHSAAYPSPDDLRSITKQGAVDPAPPQGWSRPTEGSDWIIRQAKQPDPRPLYVLVWGAITDVAQAVHDDPRIKDRIRVYSIASWNERNDPAAFAYLDEHHPDLWFIYSNSTFRGWYMGGDQEGDLGNERFVQEHVCGHGALGNHFCSLAPALPGNARGRIKMGDTPSVAYLLRGDPDDPTAEHWGGRFVPHPDGRPSWWVDDPDPRWQVEDRPGAGTVSQYRTQYLRDWQARMDRAAGPARVRQAAQQPPAPPEGRLQPYPENPHYLAWGSVPVFPLGATGYHSWTPISRPGTVDFEAQMDRLATVIDEIGSPHVRGFMRCLPYDPMNHMHDGSVERVLQPWVRLEDGRYDLSRFEPAWEERLRAYLDAALAQQIVVSLELWDDWSVTRGPGGQYDPGKDGAWNAHPFNPNNNVNYGEDVLPAATAVCDAPFYSTTPARAHNEPALALQQRYVDRVLEIASAYPNVLVNISNESRAHLDWSRFWAAYVRERMPPGSMIGEMPSTNRRDGGGECEHTFSPLTLVTDPHYDYVDVAQGVSGHEFGDAREQALGGGQRLNAYRQAMAEAGTRRPLVVSKDYARGPDEGDLVLWSRFAGGAAAARFHRPGRDHGEDVIAFQHEAVGRLGRFLAEVPFWRMHPAPELVRTLPEGAGANVLAEPEGHVVVQLVGGHPGQRIALDLAPGVWTVRWIDPARGREIERLEAAVEAAPLRLDLPADLNHRILHLQPCRRPCEKHAP